MPMVYKAKSWRIDSSSCHAFTYGALPWWCICLTNRKMRVEKHGGFLLRGPWAGTLLGNVSTEWSSLRGRASFHLFCFTVSAQHPLTPAAHCSYQSPHCFPVVASQPGTCADRNLGSTYKEGYMQLPVAPPRLPITFLSLHHRLNQTSQLQILGRHLPTLLPHVLKAVPTDPKTP